MVELVPEGPTLSMHLIGFIWPRDRLASEVVGMSVGSYTELTESAGAGDMRVSLCFGGGCRPRNGNSRYAFEAKANWRSALSALSTRS